MNKIMKKLLATVLALTLILSGTVTAFGAENTGVGIQFNGKDITDAGGGKIVNGRTMVPFRQILESMGADVSYEPSDKSILVKTADKEIAFKVGGTDLTITENGVKTLKKMDVAPFIDKNLSRTFVPVRFLAQSMGFSVGWDAVNKTVVIIDPATVFSNADTDFSVISKLMKTDLDMEKAYKTDGTFDMDVTTYAEPGSILPGMDFSVNGSISGVQQKSNADLTMKLAFQFDDMLSKLTEEEKAQMQPLLAMFKDASMKIKMNGETGVTYMNSSIFSTLDPTVGANTWYKMNMYDTYAEMGIDLKAMTNMSYSNVKLSELLTASMASMEYADTTTYQDMKTTYAFLKNLIGDDAFTKKTAGSYVTYTLKLNQSAILAAMAKTALSEGISKETMDMAELGDMLNSSDLQADIMIMEKAGSLYEYDIKGSGGMDDINLSFDMSGDQKNVECSMSFEQKDVMKWGVEMESHVTESSVAPNLSLPADAVIKDYPMYY